MASLTPEARLAAQDLNVKPNLVLKIDGYAQRFSSLKIYRYVRIGDPGLRIGPTWKIGGYTLLEDQHDYLMFGQGTTTKLSQTVAPDRGQGSGVARMVVVLQDANDEISRLISPGFELEDILARGCEVELGFEGVAYPQSYVTIIRGTFESVKSGAGHIVLAINQVEDQKHRAFVSKKNSTIVGATSESGTADIPVVDSSIFFTSVSGPAGVDTSLSFFARVGDEIIGYTTSAANTLGGISRGLFGTTPVVHDDEAEIYPYYRLQGNGMDLALKLMLSGWEGPYAENVPVTSFNKVSSTLFIDNAILFDNIDIEKEYGVVPGTYITATGSSGGNDFADLQVEEVIKTKAGSYAIIAGADFSIETPTAAVVSFRSQYDSLGAFGLKLKQQDVDVAQHELLRDRSLAEADFDFLVDSIENTKIFLDDELYKVMASFSVPRYGRASVVYHSPPLPDEEVVVIDQDGTKEPDDIQLERTLSSNFANSVEVHYDYDAVTGKYKTFKQYDSDLSLARIDTKRKPYIIKSRGLKTLIGAETLAASSANRYLLRYQYGAEFIRGFRLKYGTGYALEMGQIVLLSTEGLKITNPATGDRSARLFLAEVQNKSLDIAQAEVSVDIVNTAFGLNSRYGRIGPASLVSAAGSSTTRLNIKRSHGTPSYKYEGTKWLNFIGQRVRVHDYEFTQDAEVTLESVVEGEDSSLKISTLPFSPSEDLIVDPPAYSADADDQAIWKMLHSYISPNPSVTAGVSTVRFTVSPSDISKFQIGFPIRVHNYDYSISSPEREIVDIIGNDVIVDASLGFVPSAGLLTDLLGFADGGQCYRFI